MNHKRIQTLILVREEVEIQDRNQNFAKRLRNPLKIIK